MKNKKKKGEGFNGDEPEKKPDEESEDEGFKEESDEGEGFSDFEDEGL